jgi:bacillithiol biosynthesis cysteine-adding enzyme BshC
MDTSIHVVPVFYMGSEDADLDELNHIYLGGEKLEWKTSQRGAVGRMKIDKDLVSLISRMEGQLAVLPHGKQWLEKIRHYYVIGSAIQDATFNLINDLFGENGLVVLIADTPILKKQMTEIFRHELVAPTAWSIVEKTGVALENAGYKVQANAREINLFYLEGDLRERIEKHKHEWRVLNTPVRFNEEGLLKELNSHPEKFSPNVILRGLYQETILPNIAFIGGAGETAYWLQLKDLFDYYRVPFPVLLLRNSFLILDQKSKDIISHLGFIPEDFFLPESDLIKKWIERETKLETKLNGSLVELEKLYEQFKKQAATIDSTLEKHVDALKVKTVHRLQELEKKMYRAEKRKFTDQQRQIHRVKSGLFPKEGLQERVENISYYFALYGMDFLKLLYDHSPVMEQEFTIIEMK